VLYGKTLTDSSVYPETAATIATSTPQPDGLLLDSPQQWLLSQR
jgi:hypothetical protein